MSDIFVSYASADRDRVRLLAQALTAARGWSVWWDREIPFGSQYVEVIEDALNRAPCVLVVWSRSSVKSHWVQEEAREGLNRGVLVPVLLDEVQQPLGFRSLQAAELFKWEGAGDSPVFQKLLTDIAALLDRDVNADQAQGPTPAVEPSHAKPQAPTEHEVNARRNAAPAEEAHGRAAEQDAGDETSRTGGTSEAPARSPDTTPSEPGARETGRGDARRRAARRSKAFGALVVATLLGAAGWVAYEVQLGYFFEPSSSVTLNGREFELRGGRNQSVRTANGKVVFQVDARTVTVDQQRISVEGQSTTLPAFRKLLILYKRGQITVKADGRSTWHVDAARVGPVDRKTAESPARSEPDTPAAVEDPDAEQAYRTGNRWYAGHGVEQDFEVAAKWYLEAARKGHAVAQFNLGTMYSQGQGVPQDYDEALRWHREAAERGNAAAQNSLGVMYAEGRGVAQDDAEAVSWYRKSAEQGNAVAQYNLGRKYETGRGVSKDEEKAVEWLTRAAEQGYAAAQHDLAARYEDGLGVPKDEAMAFAWYVKAANQGHPSAQGMLGVLYANGRGVPKDQKKAVEWLTRAAEQGNAAAQKNLAIMYANGWGVAEDQREAVKWYRKAADQGNKTAQYNLAGRYKKGFGVPKDDALAFEWYSKAANQGHPSAQGMVGVMYANGLGVPKDQEKAVEWLTRAAVQGHAEAQKNLAVMYANGWGVPRDDSEAVKWYRKAARQGENKAQEALRARGLEW